jgi:hypothetical protein
VEMLVSCGGAATFCTRAVTMMYSWRKRHGACVRYYGGRATFARRWARDPEATAESSVT